MSILFAVFTSALALAPGTPPALDLTLPAYEVQMDPADLAVLEANPYTDEYFPATFTFGDEEYTCGVRFRGASSLLLPKKSWRIKFDDAGNVFDAEKLNLNAEYRDLSLMRNYLVMRLFAHNGYPASNVEFVNYFVNGDYKGVFVQVEEPNEDFLDRNELRIGEVHKAKNHAATLGPLSDYERYATTWDKRVGQEDDFSTLQELLHRVHYWTDADFAASIGSWVDVDSLLHYCAVIFTIASRDCMTKNYYTYTDPLTGRLSLFPWDNDGSLGNNWQGEYQQSNVTQYKDTNLVNREAFQRLMQDPIRNQAFWLKVDALTSEGFDWAHAEIDATWEAIRNDVYQDGEKLGTNADFDAAIGQLHQYLDERAAFLAGFTYFDRIPLTELYCSNAFPTDAQPTVTFRATSAAPQPVVVEIARDLDFAVWGHDYLTEELTLYDDGLHDDLAAGDLVYGNTLTFDAGEAALVPYAFRGTDDSTPANGLHYLEYVRTHTRAIKKTVFGEPVAQITIGSAYAAGGDYFVEIENASGVDVDLSYWRFGGAAYFENFLIPEGTSIAAGETLIVTSDAQLAQHYFPGDAALGEFPFEVWVGDTLRLMSPAMTELGSWVVNELVQLELPDVEVVINEVNYNSDFAFDPEDWVELYNRRPSAVDLSGWLLKDGDDAHAFVLPAGTVLAAKGHLVLARDPAAFSALFPGAGPVVGGFDFGFGGAGDQVRLFAPTGHLIDEIAYLDDLPWPNAADGDGPTLELRHPYFDNTLSSSWAASVAPHGTPGQVNSALIMALVYKQR